MKKTLFILVIFLSAMACGNSEKSSPDKKENTSGKHAGQSPCELLTEKEIKKVLAIPAEAETSMKEKNNTYPSCFYKWESISWRYKVIGDHMADYHAEMSIVLLENVSKEQYKSSVSYYKDGEVQNGIGDMATWSGKKTQLTFLYKGKLIHVHSKTSADVTSNKANAIDLAKLIVTKL